MKRLLVMFLALALALAPAATADAAAGKGKGKAAAKACAAKKTLNGKKGKKAKKCGKKAKKTKKAKAKVAPTAPEQAAAERECRADRRLDPEGFVADFGSGKDAVARCAAELLEQTAVEPVEDGPAEGEEIVEDAGGTDLEPEVVEDGPAEDELL